MSISVSAAGSSSISKSSVIYKIFVCCASISQTPSAIRHAEIIPPAAEGILAALNVADWLQSLVLDGIIAGVGAVLGFVPQMLVLFALLAVLE